MRYDTEIYLQTIRPGEYDAVTGDYDADVVKESLQRASVTDAGLEEVKLIYGKLVHGVKAVRLQNAYKAEDIGKIQRIRIGNTLYNIDNVKSFYPKGTLFVSEVN